MVRKKAAKKKSHTMPEWATQPFHAFLEYCQNLDHILRLSKNGIYTIQVMPKVVEALGKVDFDEEPTTYEERLENAKQDAELAQKEVDNGFPLLHAQAVVSIWGCLESQVRAFLANWLAKEPGALLVNQVQKLKVQIGDYERLTPEERPYYILDLLERDMQSSLKQGVSRFETLLEIFGMGGAVDETVRKDLFEMHQIRNVVVHRQGIADKRLATSCPWLNIEPGEIIVVSHQDLRRYSEAALGYITRLVIRSSIHFGLSKDEVKEALDKINIHK